MIGATRSVPSNTIVHDIPFHSSIHALRGISSTSRSTPCTPGTFPRSSRTLLRSRPRAVAVQPVRLASSNCFLPHGRKPHVSAIGVAHRRRSTSATNVPSRPSILFLDTTVVYVWGTVVTVWDRIAPRLAGRRRGGKPSAAKQEANKQQWMVGKAAPRRLQSRAS